jgi:hypothetical protein
VSLLKGIAAFSGWLTGALAGVGAILYALGYLVTRAHLNLLGVSGLFDQSNFFFVQEGAMFLLDISVIAARTLLPIVVVLGVIAAILSIIGYGIGRILAARDPNLAERVSGWKDSITSWHDHLRLRQVLYAGLVVLFFIHTDTYLNEFNRPLQISNVLYSDSGNLTATGSKDQKTIELRKALLEGNDQRTHTYFFNLLLGEALAGLLLVAAWHLTDGWRWQAMWVSWFVIVFIVYSASLPMVYGVLWVSAKYPIVTLNSPDASLTHDLGTLYLLSKSDTEFVVWDARGKRLLWIPKDEIKWADVKRVGNLFGPAGQN